MKITEHADGEDLALILEGDLDESSSHKAEEKIKEALAQDAKNICLDMKGVHYVSSVGIRVLILAHKKAVKLGKKIILTKMSPKVKEILETVGILPLFAASGS
jgi:anti-sigma B factor antagonist/stage II sporulation protein AA (anti-sigma F factor antagonist)